MSSPSLDPFRNVFPTHEFFRGQSRLALIWALLANAAFAGVLIAIILLVGLLDTKGAVLLQPGEAAEYASLLQAQLPVAASSPAIAVAQPQFLMNQGLQAVAWELRDRSWSSSILWLCQVWGGFRETNAAMFAVVAWGLCCGFAYSALLERVSAHADRAAGKAASQLRSSIHRQALRMGTSDLHNSGVDRACGLFSAEVETMRQGLSGWIEGVAIQPVRLVLLGVVLLALDWRLSLECAVPLLGFWYLIGQSRRRTRRVQRLTTDRAIAELDLLEEGIHKSRLVCGYRLDDFERQRFDAHLARYDGHLAAGQRSQSRHLWVFRTLALICLALIIALVALRLLADKDSGHLTLPECVLLVTCFLAGWPAIEKLAAIRELRRDATSSLDHIYRYLNAIPEVGQAVGAKFLQPLQKAIQFENVTYRSGSRIVLDSLSLIIPAGGSSAIVAFDQLEAVTLAALLPRFIEPHEGKILFDGEDIAWATLESLRVETLVVRPDEAYLTGTVLENLSGSDPKYSLNQVTEAAKLAHAHNFIQKLPQGYETVIGKHGEQLDAGQCFRLALARALLRDPAVMIIHEPIGEISDDDKLLIDDACRRAIKDRTTIFLPARLSTLRHVDRIILLNRGRVEVVGTHDVLVSTSDLYRHWEYIHFNVFRHETSGVE